ncbi:MAG: HAMP domain-containing histidine kinase [Gemmatimonadetes bacterium]|nr:HAMP domain-containing histidine kinase [Gemmatimonadota bacterium]
MQIQTVTNDKADAAARLLLPGRYDRKDDPLRPGLLREREVDLVVEMAHDLRSPLTSIISLAELLQSGQSGPVSTTQQRQLRLIYSAALCLCATASDVIELARAGDRLVEGTPLRFSMAEILATVRDMVRPMVEVRGLQLQIESAEPDQRLGFPRALSRVLLNLATNAVKNTDQGSVTISARPVGGSRMEFSVRDTGRGIEPEEMAHLFEPFHSSHEQDRGHFSSSGLGLAISHKLVSAMGSELKAETSSNRGTRFHFEIELPPAR